MSKYFSRKFLIAVVVLISSVYFLATGKITGEQFIVIVTSSVVSYEFANAIAKGKE